MAHRLAKGAQAEDIGFCPYEDVLAVGHSMGISSLLVPGSGEPNFDSYVANPYETLKQRREAEVHRLLDKLPADLITIDPDQIGGMLKSGKENQKEAAAIRNAANVANAIAAGKQVKIKHKAKGKDKPSRKHKKKQLNIINATKEKIRGEQTTSRAEPVAPVDVASDSIPRALARFKRK